MCTSVGADGVGAVETGRESTWQVPIARGGMISTLGLGYVKASFFRGLLALLYQLPVATLSHHERKAERTPPTRWHTVLEVRSQPGTAGWVFWSGSPTAELKAWASLRSSLKVHGKSASRGI